MCLKRTKLKDRLLPNYSRGEEIFNSTSHGVGAALGIVATVLCVIAAARTHDAYAIVGAAIFGTTMTALYAVSSIYHGIPPRFYAKRVMQVIDHCTIFLLIAGTYTPIALCTLRRYDARLGWTIFGIVWAAAIVGIVLNVIDLKRYKTFSVICYLLMGWCIMITAPKLGEIFEMGAIALLLAGGIAYTLGAALYVIGAKKPVMHSVFHVFTVLGSALHFFAILFYVF